MLLLIKKILCQKYATAYLLGGWADAAFHLLLRLKSQSCLLFSVDPTTVVQSVSQSVSPTHPKVIDSHFLNLKMEGIPADRVAENWNLDPAVAINYTITPGVKPGTVLVAHDGYSYKVSRHKPKTGKTWVVCRHVTRSGNRKCRASAVITRGFCQQVNPQQKPHICR